MRRLIYTAVVVIALCVAAAPAAAWQSRNQFAGARIFLNSGTQANAAMQDAQASGNNDNANLLARIADTPQATWMIAQDSVDSGYVGEWFQRLDDAGDVVPIIALHGLPQQVCAGDNAPGHRTDAEYRAWIDGWARRLDGRRSVVIIEPDGLAASTCMSRSDQARRIALVKYAATKLGGTAGIGAYIDIGAGDWLAPRTAASLLKRAGVGGTRGFSLNVTHFDWTSSEVRYGEKLSRLLGGRAHYVVNTALNGRGPQLLRGGFHAWCNPRGRSLGPLPTTQTRAAHADAFEWLQNPGLSDGGCNGGPAVGSFWLDWALQLSRSTAGAPDYPGVRHRG